MKKILFFILILSSLTTGCQSNEITSGKTTVGKTEQKNISVYPSGEDVVDKLGNYTNLDKFSTFVKNVKQGKKDKIRIVNHTTEGDPIFHELIYDGKAIESTIDTRRDKFGSGMINTTTCQSIEIQESDNRTNYNLSGCEDSNRDNSIIVIKK